MPKPEETKWEVVDRLPGEKKAGSSPRPPKPSLFSNRALWIGLGIGVLLTLFIPVLRMLAYNVARAWWIWLGLALYFVWRRAQKRANPPRRGN